MNITRLSAGVSVALTLALCVLSPVAVAQVNTDTYFGTPGGGGVNGAVGMCLDANKLARPCSDPLVVPGTNYDTFKNAGGAATIVSPSAPLPVTSYDSGPVKATCAGTPCVANSSHAAGTSVGGLFTMPLVRQNGGSGILTGLQGIMPGASVGQYVLYGWTKTPSSTCTDNSAFSYNTADDPYLIVGTPISVTPALPANTTGDSRSYFQLAAPSNPLTWDYKNNDSSPSQNIYFCLKTVATDTADENTSPILIGSGPQN